MSHLYRSATVYVLHSGLIVFVFVLVLYILSQQLRSCWDVQIS